MTDNNPVANTYFRKSQSVVGNLFDAKGGSSIAQLPPSPEKDYIGLHPSHPSHQIRAQRNEKNESALNQHLREDMLPRYTSVSKSPLQQEIRAKKSAKPMVYQKNASQLKDIIGIGFSPDPKGAATDQYKSIEVTASKGRVKFTEETFDSREARTAAKVPPRKQTTGFKRSKSIQNFRCEGLSSRDVNDAVSAKSGAQTARSIGGISDAALFRRQDKNRSQFELRHFEKPEPLGLNPASEKRQEQMASKHEYRNSQWQPQTEMNGVNLSKIRSQLISHRAGNPILGVESYTERAYKSRSSHRQQEQEEAPPQKEKKKDFMTVEAKREDKFKLYNDFVEARKEFQLKSKQVAEKKKKLSKFLQPQGMMNDGASSPLGVTASFEQVKKKTKSADKMEKRSGFHSPKPSSSEMRANYKSLKAAKGQATSAWRSGEQKDGGYSRTKRKSMPAGAKSDFKESSFNYNSMQQPRQSVAPVLPEKGESNIFSSLGLKKEQQHYFSQKAIRDKQTAQVSSVIAFQASEVDKRTPFMEQEVRPKSIVDMMSGDPIQQVHQKKMGHPIATSKPAKQPMRPLSAGGPKKRTGRMQPSQSVIKRPPSILEGGPSDYFTGFSYADDKKHLKQDLQQQMTSNKKKAQAEKAKDLNIEHKILELNKQQMEIQKQIQFLTKLRANKDLNDQMDKAKRTKKEKVHAVQKEKKDEKRKMESELSHYFNQYNSQFGSVPKTARDIFPAEPRDVVSPAKDNMTEALKQQLISQPVQMFSGGDDFGFEHIAPVRGGGGRAGPVFSGKHSQRNRNQGSAVRTGASAELTYASSDCGLMNRNSRKKQMQKQIVMSHPADQVSPLRSPLTHALTSHAHEDRDLHVAPQSSPFSKRLTENPQIASTNVSNLEQRTQEILNRRLTYPVQPGNNVEPPAHCAISASSASGQKVVNFATPIFKSGQYKNDLNRDLHSSSKKQTTAQTSVVKSKANANLASLQKKLLKSNSLSKMSASSLKTGGTKKPKRSLK